jgi:hypothetical protein
VDFSGNCFGKRFLPGAEPGSTEQKKLSSVVFHFKAHRWSVPVDVGYFREKARTRPSPVITGGISEK